MLRIRDNEEATIKQIDIPKEQMEVMEKVLKANITDTAKEIIIKKFANGLCCICRLGIPIYLVSYPVPDGGATRIERYCETCSKKVFAREQIL